MSARRSAFAVSARIFALGVLTVLGACSTVTTTSQVVVSSTSNWAVLEMENLSQTPLAGARAARLIETHLRDRGIDRIATWQREPGTSLVALLSEERRGNAAMQWAQAHGIRYALSGAIHEWNYKRIPDGEPVVGLTLSITDVATGHVIWQGTASRSGWGPSTLSGVADRVVSDLLAEVRFAAPLRDRRDDVDSSER